MDWVDEVALRNCIRENQTIFSKFGLSKTNYCDGTIRIQFIFPQQRMPFQTTAYLQNSCEHERRVILMASAMAFPPTVCAQWPVGNTQQLTYSHSSRYLHIFAHTTLHRSVVRKRKKWVLFMFVDSRPYFRTSTYAMISQKDLVLLADWKRFSIYLSLLWIQRSRQRFVLINPFLHISNPLNMQRPMETSPAELH